MREIGILAQPERDAPEQDDRAEQHRRRDRLGQPAMIHGEHGDREDEAARPEDADVRRQNPRHREAHAGRASPSSSARRKAAKKRSTPAAPSRPATSTSALPTTTPSAMRDAMTACAGVEIPKPMAIGSVVAARTRATDSVRSVASEV